MRNAGRLLSLLLCSASLTAAQPAGTAGDAASRFGGSLRLPASTFDPAPQSPLAGVTLPPGAIRLKSFQSVRAETLKAVFSDVPALFGERCGEQELLAFPAAPEEVQALSARLLARPGNTVLIDQPRELAFQQGEVFSLLTPMPGGYYLASCRVAAEKSAPAVITAVRNYYAGQVPTLILAESTGLLAWCRGGTTARQFRAFEGSITALTISADGHLLAVAGWAGGPTVRVYDAGTGSVKTRLMLERGAMSLAFSGDGQSLLVQNADREYVLYDLQTGNTAGKYQMTSLLQGQFQGAGPELFVNFESRTSPLRVFEGKTGLATRNIRSLNVADYSLVPGAQWLAVVTATGELLAYQTRLKGPGNLATKPDVSQTLGVRTGGRLFPGPEADEVLAVLFRRDEQKNVLEPWSWRVNTNEIKRLPDVEYRAGDLLTVNTQTRAVGGVRPCLPGVLLRR